MPSPPSHDRKAERTTLDEVSERGAADADHAPLETLVATILLHPDGRAGEVCVLDDLPPGLPRELSRVRPLFQGPAGARGLDTARVSRRPLWLVSREGELLICAGPDPGVRASVDGEPLLNTHRVPLSRLRDPGVLLEIGGAVLLWLCWRSPEPSPIDGHGILGVSPAARAIRADVDRAARSPALALICGESGVGKELVARAIHQASARARGPWVAVNMAAVPQSMAAAELFGHGKGAFTGATEARKGWFEQAHRGTLFLDEIGETPFEVQPQLLRALDEGEIQPVGQATRRVDVRLISATDADLDQMVQARRFRAALYHRISGTIIAVPPLRARRVDVPILLQRFLAEDLRRFGASARLQVEDSEPQPWLRPRLLLQLMSWHFPGNVRELRNLSLDIAAGSHNQPAAALPEAALARISQAPDEPRRAAPTARLSPATAPLLSEPLVREALRQNDWILSRAALSLGVARNTLIEAMAKMPDLRQARELDAPTVRGALDAADGSIEDAARRLRVSAHGLRLRMNALGLERRR